MPYIAVDTSTQTLTIAVGESGRLLGEASMTVKKNHSNLLMPMIESLLVDLELSPDNLQGIIIGQGPGSYTGVRVGVTTGKMLAWALRVPLVGISSLDGLARHFMESDLLVCPMFDARRQQAYCSVYERQILQGKRTFVKIEADALRKMEILFPLLEARLAERQEKGKPEQVVFLGDGAANYRDLINERFGIRAEFAASASQVLVRAAYLLDEGIAKIEAGESDEIESFAPEYLQMVEAEAKLLARKGS